MSKKMENKNLKKEETSKIANAIIGVVAYSTSWYIEYIEEITKNINIENQLENWEVLEKW